MVARAYGARGWLAFASIAIAAASLVGVSSCSKMPLVAPSGSAITLVADTNVLPVNGSTNITAIVLQGALTSSGTGNNTGTTTTNGVGTPVHNGTVVSFTTSLGKIEPAQVDTDGGKATAMLIADGRSGVATVTAFSGAATKTLTVNIGAAGAARIVVSASPQSLPATGGQSAIVANVQDQQGNGLLGVPVTFSTSLGSLSSTTALTDETGNAASTLTTTSGPATVTASAGGGTTGTLTGTVTVNVRAKTQITITPPASITQSIPASFGVSVGTGTVVTDLVLAFGDGGKVDLGAVSSSTTTSHLYGDAGIYDVSATATDSDGGTTTVATQVAVASLNLTAGASPTSAALGTPITFTVTVPTGASISSYQWDFGEGDPPTQTTSSQVSHVFRQRGSYTVVITVFPTAGKAIKLVVGVAVT